ncbi:MAG: ABC transporter permease, partial [Candidatus Omnitrophica bacterium]|nr:ABC transporter permease [Candidatus Omnitrophota bacterium]
IQGLIMLLKEARFGIFAAVIAGFGRVFAEIGVSMMLGGNIRGYTRNITTTIALETSKGEFSLGIALGMVLLMIAFAINIIFAQLQRNSKNCLCIG